MSLFTPLRKKFTFGLLTVLVVLNTVQAQDCPTLIWSDEFDQSSLDMSSWQYDIGNGTNGWGNNELQYYTSRPDNIKLQDGKLIITALEEDYSGFDYTSAKITSAGKRYFKYGRMEARIKLPRTQGIWPAFWMMPNSSVYGGWPRSGEIDIMEFKGGNVYSTYGTIHYGTDPGAGHEYTGGFYSSSTDLSEDFHVYSVEWKADTISWYIDDVNFYNITKTAISPNAWPFDQDFFFILNFAIGGNFGGNPNGTTLLPQSMEVDYVRVYSNPNTLQITGATKAIAGQTYQYSLTNGNATAYVWSVPSGATINTGQGSKTISVTWGATGGDVSVEATQGTCGVHTYAKEVSVIPNGCDVVFADFESNVLLTYSPSTTGIDYHDDVANPVPNSVNASSTIASYQRNSFEQYDVLKYDVNFLPTSVDYENGRNVLYMDLYTAAPVGTVINWQFENKARATLAYPAGRRAIFRAVTTKQNEWERVKFVYQSKPDGNNTLPTEIDQFTILFDPNDFTGDVYYIDNIMRRDVFNCGLPTSLQDAMEQQFVVSPNPAHDQLNLNLSSLPSGELNVTMVDVLGVERLSTRYTIASSSQQESVDVSVLKPGVYVLYAKQEGAVMLSRKIIIQ